MKLKKKEKTKNKPKNKNTMEDSIGKNSRKRMT